MSITPLELVGYQKAEFSKASKWRLILLLVQFLAIVPAALSVIVTGTSLLYMLAVIGPVLLIVWWVARGIYRSTRSAAHAARRANLILGGLGTRFSPEEHQRLRQLFTVPETAAQAAADPNYYATAAAVGNRRLGEMLEESAFYSKEVHRFSANIMVALFLAFISLAAIALLVGVPYADRVTAITGIKFMLAVSVFLLSSDVLGAMTEHREASRISEAVQMRMAAAHAKSFPPGDVLLAMTDYNNAMEGAPEAVPGVFKRLEKRLNIRWDEYKRDREETRAAGSAGA